MNPPMVEAYWVVLAFLAGALGAIVLCIWAIGGHDGN